MPTDILFNTDLVRNLIDTQFPQWKHLPLAPVVPGGWDNRTFRLGTELLVRLPSGEGYAAQVAKEQQWLPRLAAQLSFRIPRPVAVGVADSSFPWSWSVYEWIDGEVAADAKLAQQGFAGEVTGFLGQMHRCETAGAPEPGWHNYFRGGDLSVYDGQSNESFNKLVGRIDVVAARKLWSRALASKWQKKPVWVHGDLAAGNILVKDGKVAAVIDFGCCAVGDPACDFALAWTFLNAEARAFFRTATLVDEETWTRGRGWVLWKAMLIEDLALVETVLRG